MGLPGWGDTSSGELLENFIDSVPTGAKGYRMKNIQTADGPGNGPEGKPHVKTMYARTDKGLTGHGADERRNERLQQRPTGADEPAHKIGLRPTAREEKTP